MQVMAFSQQGHGLPRGDGDYSSRLRREENIVQPTSAANALHSSGVRHGHEIILIPTASGCSLGLEYTDDATRHRLDTDAFADGVFVGKEILDYRLTKEANGN